MSNLAGQGRSIKHVLAQIIIRTSFLQHAFRLIGILLILLGYQTLGATADLDYYLAVDNVYYGITETFCGGMLIVVSLLLK